MKLTDLDWADVFSSLLPLLDFPINEGKDSTCHDVSYACSNEAEIKVKTWIFLKENIQLYKDMNNSERKNTIKYIKIWTYFWKKNTII